MCIAVHLQSVRCRFFYYSKIRAAHAFTGILELLQLTEKIELFSNAKLFLKIIFLALSPVHRYMLFGLACAGEEESVCASSNMLHVCVSMCVRER